MNALRYNVEFILKASTRPGSELSGEATFIFSGGTQHFGSIMELASLIEENAREVCSHLEHKLRSWTRASLTLPRERQSESERQGHNQTFHISIKFAENYTWQGRVQWLEGRRSLHFGSFLELMGLMDEAARTAAKEVSTSIEL